MPTGWALTDCRVDEDVRVEKSEQWRGLSPQKHRNVHFDGLYVVILRFRVMVKTDDFTQAGERRIFKGGDFLDHRDTLFRP